MRGGGVIGYDRLVVAPGIRFLWGTPEGYDEASAARMPHAWQGGPQTSLLAAQLRAMADGGWRILRYESELARCAFEDQPESEKIAIKEWMMENTA